MDEDIKNAPHIPMNKSVERDGSRELSFPERRELVSRTYKTRAAYNIVTALTLSYIP